MRPITNHWRLQRVSHSLPSNLHSHACHHRRCTHSLSISSLHSSYGAGTSTVTSTMESLLSRRSESISNGDNVFIHIEPDSHLLQQSAHLDSLLTSCSASSSFSSLLSKYPLFGIPFAIKDNIDVAGLPTTAGCPGFAYEPESSAPCVSTLQNLGAILVGKTNLDQFATGLVGVRSPYGVARNKYSSPHSQLIPGGSSSGSAVAVSRELCSFALGTDTAGSGRVPAGLNHLIGLKPSRGLIDTTGVFPACKSLDCVSVFSNNISDARRVFLSLLQHTHAHPSGSEGSGSRPVANLSDLEESVFGRDGRHGSEMKLNIGIPDGILAPQGVETFFKGDTAYYRNFVDFIEKMGNESNNIVPIDFEPFFETARLLYEGPWVSERLWALPFLKDEDASRRVEGVHDTVRQIVASGARFSAVDAFDANYRLEALRRDITGPGGILDALEIDVLCVPTIPTSYTVEEVLNDPVKLNSNLGLYTNFVNLLQMCAIVVPTSMVQREEQQQLRLEPCSVTIIGRDGCDLKVMDVAERVVETYYGRGGEDAMRVIGEMSDDMEEKLELKGHYEIVVCGAHMEGFGLNYQLRDRGARLVRKDHAKRGMYEMYAIEGGKKPGMVRRTEGAKGTEMIEVEVWAFEDAKQYADFVAKCVNTPLCVGSVELESGKVCKGFVMESYVVQDQNVENITQFEGWRAYKMHSK